MSKWYLYILECSCGSYYTGITNDLEKRIKAHNAGTASKYTRSRLPVKLVYYYPFIDRASASSAEYRIKKLTRLQKSKLIDGSLIINNFVN